MAAIAALNDAIASGGSSLRDYVQPSGELGYFSTAGRMTKRVPAPAAPMTGENRRHQGFLQGGRSTPHCLASKNDPLPGEKAQGEVGVPHNVCVR